MKEILYRIYLYFSPAFTTIGIYFFVVLGYLPLFFLIANAERLKILFVPLFLIYLALLIATGRYIQHRKQMREYKAQYGEELFYRMFPQERKHEERMAKITQLINRIRRKPV